MEKRSIRFVIALVVLIAVVLVLIFIDNLNLTGKAVEEGGLGLSPPLIPNTLTISNPTAAPVANYPVQFGRPFTQGEFPQGTMPGTVIDGVPVQTQVDVKNRWPDGSLKFAIISFILPQINAAQSKTVAFQSLTDAEYQNTVGTTGLTPAQMLDFNFNFGGTMELTQAGQTQTISARTMLQNNHIHKTWMSGPVATSVVLADHSANRQYDIGWKQQGTLITGCSTGSPCTVLSVNDASWASVGQQVNLNDEIATVTAVNTAANPDTITVTRRTGGIVPDYEWEVGGGITANAYITSNNWQTLSLPADNQYKSFRPIFDVTFWPAINRYQITMIGEITNTESLQDLTYNVVLKTGDPASFQTTVLTQNGVTQHYGTRWMRTYWGGGTSTPLPQIKIDHNLQYLSLTGFVDPYDPSVNVPVSTVNNLHNSWTSSNKNLMNLGIFTSTAMGTAGARPELGIMPQWDALWLHTMENKAKEITLSQAELGASWQVHFREGDASKNCYNRDVATGNIDSTPSLGRVVSPNCRPSLSTLYPLQFATSADKLNFVSRFTNGKVMTGGGWSISSGHYYNLNSIAYLLTGKFSFYEENLFWASNAAVYHYYQTFDPYGERYQARQAITMMWSSIYGEDGTPENALFDQLWGDAIVGWMGMLNIPLSQEPSIPVTAWSQNRWNYGRTRGQNNFDWPNQPDLPAVLNFWLYGSGGSFAPINLDNIGNPSQPVGKAHAPWQYAIFPADLLGKAEDMEYPVHSLLEYIADYYNWHFTTPGFTPIALGVYQEPTLDTSGAELTSPMQIWNAYTTSYQNNPCFMAGPQCDNPPYISDGYQSYHTAAGAKIYSIDPTAYNWLRADAQSTYNAGIFNSDPRYAIYPRELFLASLQCTGTQPTCLTQGVCIGATLSCSSNVWSCQYPVTYQSTETTCDGLDNDCDGTVDEGCTAQAPSAPGNLQAFVN